MVERAAFHPKIKPGPVAVLILRLSAVGFCPQLEGKVVRQLRWFRFWVPVKEFQISISIAIAYPTQKYLELPKWPLAIKNDKSTNLWFRSVSGGFSRLMSRAASTLDLMVSATVGWRVGLPSLFCPLNEAVSISTLAKLAESKSEKNWKTNEGASSNFI